MKKIIYVGLSAALLICSFSKESKAQNNNVGIGTTTPNASAMLDVVSTSKGVLIPRVTNNQMNTIAAPSNGLLVYNTDSACFFFYKSSAWSSLCNAGGSGSVGPTGPTGPAGTNGTPGTSGATGATGPSGTNGIAGVTGATGSTGLTGPTGGASQTAWWVLGNTGTTAGTNFLGTNDVRDLVMKTSSFERMRIMAAGLTVVNATAAKGGDVFSVYGTGYPGALNSIGTSAINGYTSGAGVGVYGENIGTGPGVVGVSTSGNGVFGQANGGLVTGTSGINTNIGGTGIIGVGNNITPGTLIAGGSGITANGTEFGLVAITTNVGTGNGIAGAGNNATINTLTTGSGVAGTGFNTGVYGYSTSTTVSTDRAGGYFQTNGGGSFSFVGFIDNTNVARKIAGNGVVSTIVKDLDGNNVYLACPEAPENLFEDYGKGVLVNGKAHIIIDPILSKNIVVNEQHELRVFIQLEGDCKGVFVTNKTQTSFDVSELQNGKSNVKFSWHIVANRADEKLPDGTISKYSSGRFTPATGPLTNKEHKTLEYKAPDLKEKR